MSYRRINEVRFAKTSGIGPDRLLSKRYLSMPDEYVDLGVYEATWL